MSKILKIFQRIMAFALDSPDIEKFPYEELNLNDEIFCEQLYVNRQSEVELRSFLEDGRSPIMVIGYPGSGKSTLVRKVLYDLESRGNYYNIIIDFKNNSILDYLDNTTNVNTKIMQYLEHKVKAILHDEPYFYKKVVMYLIRQLRENKIGSNYGNLEFLNLYHSINLHFELEKQNLDFVEWFEFKCYQDSEFQHMLKEMILALQLEDYLIFLKNKGLGTNHICIFFDNVDSIIDTEVRENFLIFMRKFAAVVSSTTNIITCLRERTILEVPDYSTYLSFSLFLGYRDFITSGEFGKAILDKRVSYFDLIWHEISHNELERNNIKTINELLRKDIRISATCLDISNYDRRQMLIIFNNFIEYMLNTIYSVDELGENDEERSVVLETYFYEWVATENIPGQQLCNIVKVYNEWLDQPENKMEMSLEQYIVAVVMNLTNNYSQNFDFLKRTTIGAVTNLINQLGYSDSEIRQKIFDLYKDEKEYRGLFEINKFTNLRSPDDLLEYYQICVTPRASQFLQYTAYKFHYITALLKISLKRDIGYQKMNLTTLNLLDSNLTFLCRVAEMYLDGLRNIKNKLLPLYHEKWFEHYRKYFCIKTNALAQYGDNYGNLYFDNLLDSHKKYLSKYFKSYNSDVENKVKEQYDKLAVLFNKEVVYLLNHEDKREMNFSDYLDFSVFK